MLVLPLNCLSQVANAGRESRVCLRAHEHDQDIRYQNLDLIWFMDKVVDGTCIIEKVIFDRLTHNLVYKSLRTNI